MSIKVIVNAFLSFAFSIEAFSGAKFNPKGKACDFDKFMQRFVDRNSEAPKFNTFMVAENVPHPDHEYWVYWPQTKKIILIAWPLADCETSSLGNRRSLDLIKDIVKTAKEINGSTYLETEDWAKSVIYDAAKNGYQMNIIKSAKK